MLFACVVKGGLKIHILSQAADTDMHNQKAVSGSNYAANIEAWQSLFVHHLWEKSQPNPDAVGCTSLSSSMH